MPNVSPSVRETPQLQLRKTRSLKPGGRVFVIGPSSPFPISRLEAGIARLEKAGFDVTCAPNVLRKTHAYLNGTDAERLHDLHVALTSDADAIWLARGGYGLGRIVEALEIPDGTLPTVVGFSDATALLAKLLSNGVPGVHGPLVTSVSNEPDDAFEHLLSVVAQTHVGRALPCRRHHERPLLARTPGWLFPANLCVLSHLVGTPALPSLDGAVLLIEEVGERPYRIDRMLTQLQTSGVLDGVVAIAVGHLNGCEEPKGSAVPAPSPLDVILERAGDRPVVSGLAVGHQPPNFALPVGAPVALVPTDDDDGAKLVFEPTSAPRAANV